MGRLTPFLDDLVLAVAIVVLVLLLAPAALPWVLVAVAVYAVVKVWMFRAHLRTPAIGTEAMVGRVATALADLGPRGQVDLDGEIWNAVAEEPARAGERVRVVGVEGLTLRVAPVGVAGPVREPRRDSVLLGLAERLRRP